MATDTETSMVWQIGEAAGIVWRALEEYGPLSPAKLSKVVELPRDTAMQAVGWLAREGKLSIEETSRGKLIALTPDE